ncbi:MAG TPA: sugar ABC transporter ATP-binding protein, partial [Anaerovoracaceae bacterium]|nr:sugar ABC transporter ATP-binding protein [Anaerovoracaceae bacterium]
DKGIIELDGKNVKFKDPLEAMNSGIAMVFQELNLFGEMTVAENIMMGKMAGRHGFIEWDACYSEVEKFLESLGINVDSRVKVKDISIAKQQLVEIAKCLYHNPKIIFLDEPSSSLSQVEEAILYKLVRDLKEKGITVVLITHKMEEIYNLCDTITIMRDGHNVSNGSVKDYTLQDITQHMLGKATEIYKKSTVTNGNYDIKRMVVNNLSVEGKLDNISFNLYEREILAFTGLVGSGKSEIARALFGVYGKTEGAIIIKEKVVKIRQPIDAIRNGIGYLPISRKEEGIIQNFNTRENITVTILDKLGFFIKRAKEIRISTEMMERFNVMPRKQDVNICNLSGGNQQKAILTRWIASKQQIILLDEPTRGVDVGAKQEIYDNLKKMSSEGIGVIIFTAETEELLSSSDRILVMRNGKIIKELTTAKTSSEEILKYSIAGMI